MSVRRKSLEDILKLTEDDELSWEQESKTVYVASVEDFEIYLISKSESKIKLLVTYSEGNPVCLDVSGNSADTLLNSVINNCKRRDRTLSKILKDIVNSRHVNWLVTEEGYIGGLVDDKLVYLAQVYGNKCIISSLSCIQELVVDVSWYTILYELSTGKKVHIV